MSIMMILTLRRLVMSNFLPQASMLGASAIAPQASDRRAVYQGALESGFTSSSPVASSFDYRGRTILQKPVDKAVNSIIRKLFTCVVTDFNCNFVNLVPAGYL
jgi:hypothetical protein